jgi:outer membrane protein
MIIKWLIWARIVIMVAGTMLMGAAISWAQAVPEKDIPDVLTLQKALNLAYGNQPSLRVAAGNVAVNEARIGEARAGYYPQINGSLSYLRSTANPAFSFFGTPVPRNVTGDMFGRYLNSVTLNQVLFDFGNILYQTRTAEFNAKAARSDTETTLQTTVLNVQQAYYGLQQAQRLLTVSDEAVAQFQKHLDLAKGRFKVGVAPKIDVTTAEVDMSNARLNLITAKNNLSLARVTLNNAMGITTIKPYRVEEPPPVEEYSITMEDALQRAFRARPELISQRALEQAADYAVKTATTNYFPNMTGSAGYSYNGNDFPLVPNWNFQGTINIPIFSGFLTSQQVAEARANLLKTKANGDVLKQTVLADVSQAYLNLEAARERLRFTAITVTQAKERMALVEGRYRAGLATAVEVTDAEVALVNAQVNDVVAMSNHQAAKAQLERAMGTAYMPVVPLPLGPPPVTPTPAISPELRGRAPTALIDIPTVLTARGSELAPGPGPMSLGPGMGLGFR